MFVFIIFKHISKCIKNLEKYEKMLKESFTLFNYISLKDTCSQKRVIAIITKIHRNSLNFNCVIKYVNEYKNRLKSIK